MSCLNATFTLTPLAPTSVFSGYSFLGYTVPGYSASLECFGADFVPWSYNLAWADTNNRLYFDGDHASDPTIDYSQWSNRKRARYVQLDFSMSAPAPNKQLALIFGFTPLAAPARVQVYSDAKLLSDQMLNGGDSQFLLVVDPPDPTKQLVLYFMHAGGSWSFSGISGYLV